MVAGLAGISALVLAAILFIDQLGDSDTTTAAPTTTTTAGVNTSSDTSPDRTSPPTFDPGGTTVVVDDTGTVSVAIPSDWIDVSGTGWVIEGDRVGPAITAAWNVDDWYSSWGTPGAFVGISTTEFEPQSGDFSSVCSPGDTFESESGSIAGTVTAWSGCGPEASEFHVLIASPADASYSVLIQLVTIDGSGAETLEGLLNTLSYQP